VLVLRHHFEAKDPAIPLGRLTTVRHEELDVINLDHD
jgi:hypothetical protein